MKPNEINPYEIISETTLKSNKSFVSRLMLL